MRDETTNKATDAKVKQKVSVEIKVPELPESVADAVIAAWRKQPGEAVTRDETLLDLETDKVILEVPAQVLQLRPARLPPAPDPQ